MCTHYDTGKKAETSTPSRGARVHVTCVNKGKGVRWSDS